MGDEVLRKLQETLEFEEVEVLQENHRYTVRLIKQNGEKRILKVTTDPSLAENLHRETRNNLFFSDIIKHNPDSVFRVRRIHAFGPGWYIGEHFDVPQLFKSRSKKAAVSDSERYLAPFVAEVDTYTPEHFLGQSFYFDEKGKPAQRYKKRMKEMENCAKTAQSEKFIKKSESEAILGFIKDKANRVTKGIELFDMYPYELFQLKDDKVGVIDLEYVNIAGRRYFDLVWFYLVLWLDMKRPEAARALLREFMTFGPRHEFKSAFMVLFGEKLLGYLRDAALWHKDTRKHGKKVVYSHEQMREILDIYLHFDIKELE